MSLCLTYDTSWAVPEILRSIPKLDVDAPCATVSESLMDRILSPALSRDDPLYVECVRVRSYRGVQYI